MSNVSTICTILKNIVSCDWVTPKQHQSSWYVYKEEFLNLCACFFSVIYLEQLCKHPCPAQVRAMSCDRCDLQATHAMKRCLYGRVTASAKVLHLSLMEFMRWLSDGMRADSQRLDEINCVCALLEPFELPPYVPLAGSAMVWAYPEVLSDDSDDNPVVTMRYPFQ